MTYLVASLAIETGIPPSQLLKESPEMFQAMLQVFSDRAEKVREIRANRR